MLVHGPRDNVHSSVQRNARPLTNDSQTSPVTISDAMRHPTTEATLVNVLMTSKAANKTQRPGPRGRSIATRAAMAGLAATG